MRPSSEFKVSRGKGPFPLQQRSTGLQALPQAAMQTPTLDTTWSGILPAVLIQIVVCLTLSTHQGTFRAFGNQRGLGELVN